MNTMAKQLSYNFIFLFLSLSLNAQKQGQARIDSLESRLKNYSSACTKPCLGDSFKVNILNDLGFYISPLKPDTAIFLSRKAYSLADKIGWVRGKTDALLKIGDYLRNKGNFDSSLFYEEEVIKICEKQTNNDVKSIINKGIAYQGIATIYRDRGNITEAIQYYKIASNIFQSQNDQWRVSNCFSGIGVCYEIVGKYADALSNQLKSLAIKESLKDRKGVGNAYGNIGILYKNLKDYSKAIEYYQKAKNEFEMQNNPMNVATTITNLGQVYIDRNELDLAIENFEKALSIFENIKAGDKIPIVIANIADVYAKQKKFSKALELHLTALRMKMELKSKKSICNSLLNIGSLYSEMNISDSAEKYLLKAFSISQINNYVDDTKDISEELFKLYSTRQNHEKALFFYQKFAILKDSLTNDATTNKFESQMLNFEFEKKKDSVKAEQEKQIAIAEADKKRAIAEADIKIFVSEAEKKLLLAENNNKRIVAETEKQKMGLVLNQQKMNAAFESKEAKQKIKLANVETQLQKQKTIRYSIAGVALLFIIASLFSFLFYKRNAQQKQKETSLSLQVSETEMKALRSQMNPHFIFNALQSIQTFLLSHKSEEANLYLLKFAKLMRLVLENSQHSEVSLKEDMQALELYMQLESIRLPHPFTYRFHIDKSVDEENDTIPPLILQPFVENAIWHGLQYKPGPGHINIYISKNDNALCATVEDNGVGRDMSRQVAQPMLLKKESLGMKLTEERLKVLNEVKKTKSGFKITDLFTPEYYPAGTKVELSLPFETL